MEYVNYIYIACMVILLRLLCVSGEDKLAVQRTSNQYVSTGVLCKQTYFLRSTHKPKVIVIIY